MSIAYKEARETKYWLRLLRETDFIDQQTYNSHFSKCEEISRILYRTIKTARANAN